MSKRKCEDEVQRFVWKRNVKYDISLLNKVKSKNPFARSNQKSAWMSVAKALQEGTLKMKVTDLNCRERITELLKAHRKGDVGNIQASVISKEEMTKFKKLLTSVAILWKESIRSEALLEVGDSESSDDSSDDDEEASSWNGGRSNPKNDLIRYLEKKNEKEIVLRKEELRIREKEADNKAKELKMLRARAVAEADERKKMSGLLANLVELVSRKKH